ncbi:MAG: hypothetical protein JSU63_02985 [Phycisphaerales bacterium]|nr:MAG: hypothetical protein JSU63_02985 [Phycisphaerales bacterium]
MRTAWDDARTVPSEDGGKTCRADGATMQWVPVSATGGHTIVGNEIRLGSGGQEVTLEIRLSGWAPYLLRAYRAVVSSAGYENGVADPLNPKGWPGTPHDGVFIDTGHPDWVGMEFYVVNTATLDYEWAASQVLAPPIADAGGTYYGGTLILEVPQNAAGSYTISFKEPPDTYMEEAPPKNSRENELPRDIEPLTLGDATIVVEPPPPPPPDYYASPSIPTSTVWFGGDDHPPIVPALPADFFGPGSDPFTREAYLQGDPIDPAALGDTSTILQRSRDPVLPADPPGTAGTADVTLVELSLISSEPMIVSYNGSQDPEEWMLHVGLSPTPAPLGQIEAVKDHANGGLMYITLYVQPLLTFTRISDGETIILDTALEGEGPYEVWNDMFFVHAVSPHLNVFHDPATQWVCGIEEVDPGDPDSQVEWGLGVWPHDMGLPDLWHFVFLPSPPSTPISPPGLPSDPTHAARKNRYISIDPSTNSDSEVALRVDLAEMMRCTGDLRRTCSVDGDCPNVCDNDADITCAGDPACGGGTCVVTAPCIHHPDEGLSWWVQEPQQEPLGCRLPGGCTDEDWFARLDNAPHFRTWNNFGVADSSLLHISDCQITPVATYAVSVCLPASGDICSDSLMIGTILRPPPGNYGDVVGPVDPVTTEFDPPNQILNVGDISGYLLTNLNYGLPGDPKPQAHWTWVDVEGQGDPFYRPQGILNVSDLNQILFGLAGRPFSWAGNNVDPGDCP